MLSGDDVCKNRLSSQVIGPVSATRCGMANLLVSGVAAAHVSVAARARSSPERERCRS